MGLRLYQIAATDFPVSDGGMFYNMIQDLRNNHFALPAVTTYNGSIIPFAYPPLSFYLIAAISSVTGFNALDVMRWFAPLANGLCIIAVFMLAKTLFKSSEKGAVSALIFALVPTNFFLLSAGGGVARSLGYFFAILALAYLYLTYTVGNTRQIVLCGVFCALALLSHPIAGQFTAYSGLFMFLFWGRSKKGILATLYIGVVAVVMLLPWLIPVIATHGIAIFGYAFLTSPPSLSLQDATRYLLSLNYVDEGGIRLFSVLGIIGLIKCIVDRKLFLPILFLAMIYLMARSPNDRSAIIVPLLATVAIFEVVIPLCRAIMRRIAHRQLQMQQVLAPVLVVLGLYGSVAVIRTEQTNLRLTLSPADRQAMAWAATQTPSHAEFLIFDKVQTAGSDTVLEWFPALSHRQSPTVPFGQEWVGYKMMSIVTNYYDNLRSCSNKSLACVEGLANAQGLQFDYIYVSDIDYSDQWQGSCCSTLLESLQHSSNYTQIYGAGDIFIFKKRLITF